jgi:DNA phosphorothioation-dependent restriction protein DptG
LKGKTTHFGCPKFQSTLTNPFQIVNIAWSLVRPQFFIFAEDWGRISPGREDVKRSELDKKQQAVEKLFHYVILSEAKNLTQGVILNPSIALQNDYLWAFFNSLTRLHPKERASWRNLIEVDEG